MVEQVLQTDTLRGLSVSPGKVAARICLYSHKNYQKAALRIRRRDMDPCQEVKRYADALDYCESEIARIRNRVCEEIGEAEAAVFDAQMALLKDPAMIHEIETIISNRTIPFEEAVEEVFSKYEAMFANLDNAYLQERSTDIGEVKRRLLNFGYETEPGFVCSGQKACGRGYHSIIVAEELTAEMVMEIDLSRVLGIVTEHGGVNGHAAILARAAGIPAVTGVKNAMDYARCGMSLFLNASDGVVQFNPSEEIFSAFSQSEDTVEEEIQKSLDGVQVFANCSSTDATTLAVSKGADGIGLFRTEMLFLHENRLLSEEEQVSIYSDVCEKMEGKPVTFRLLDIGGDKALPFLNIEKEENPFLGFRGARFLLGNPAILRTQIRALLRTSSTFPLKIMFPMVVDTDQLDRLLQEVTTCATLLDVDMNRVELGIMFEVPSAVFQAKELLSRVSFGSIGSNDLMQYLFAVDRNNELVAEDYDKDHPVLWHTMEMIVNAARETGTSLTLCGELASYPGYAQRLFAIGITSLSVSPQLIGAVRRELNTAISQTL